MPNTASRSEYGKCILEASDRYVIILKAIDKWANEHHKWRLETSTGPFPEGLSALVTIYYTRIFHAYLSYQSDLDDCDRLSPLILDLDGDGVEADALTYFDHAGDGWSELSRWANEDDGVLVWDRNGDGIINNGTELFGNNTVLSGGGTAENGFAALADLDNNGDGIVDSRDEAWSELRVMRWNDVNDDGLVQAGEKNPGDAGFAEHRLIEYRLY